MICAGKVFRCFRTLERWGNYFTGAAGPYFVGLACILIGLGVVCFFDVLAPSFSYPILTVPICALIALNLVMHYYYCVTVPPGFVDGNGEQPPQAPREQQEMDSILWAKRKGGTKGKARATRMLKVTSAGYTRCWKCNHLRPERSHHCKVCNRCVLKYDHHCPTSESVTYVACKGINQCVGLHNERHFVLFMAYLVLSTFCYCMLGYGKFFDSIGITFTTEPWPHHVPEFIYSLIYTLSGVLGFAVAVMLAFHVWTLLASETTVEAQDHDAYRRRAAEREEDFVNSYDLGRWRNLETFFNVGEGGYSVTTLFFPLRVRPYTDGYSWARREGYDKHAGLLQGEELTDDDDDNP